MWDQEKHHLATFNKLIPEHRSRPTLLLPLWSVAGYALGAGTALLGKEAAMACTVAVEVRTVGVMRDSDYSEHFRPASPSTTMTRSESWPTLTRRLTRS